MPDSTPPLSVAVFVSGRGSNLKALLDAHAAGRLPRVRFVAVFSDVADPPAFQHAAARGAPTFHRSPSAHPNKRIYEADVLRDLRSVGADFIVLAGYMRIVGPTLLDAFPGRIVNVHPSLLPAFPGLDAQKQAIECGAKVSGCTVHFVDAGVDTGPIIVQRALEVEVGETADSLAARILALEHEALPEALRLISEGRVEVEGRRVRIREK
jgi:phosphoribosylglycinamide formyltransferase-1